MLLRQALFASIFLCSLANSAIQINSDKQNPAISSIVETADAIANEYHEMGWYSGSILIAKDSQIIFEKSYGYANVTEQLKNHSNTKFNLGSIMKNYTKVLVLQQVLEKSISLEDTLDKYKLGFPEEISSKVTVKDLLNHSSGFKDIFVAEYRENQLSFDTLDKKLQLLINEPLLFEPGTDNKYSNYGYIVLGAILEKVTKKPFDQLIQHNIFDRIGLSNASFSPNETDKNQSTRYTYQYNNSLREVGITEHPGPDGGIESNASDVQKFYRELFYGDKLLERSDEVIRMSFAMDGEHWRSYGGGLGISAAVEINLIDGIEIIVLANTDNLIAERISQRINSYIKSGKFEAISALEANYAYSFYKDQGKTNFYEQFKDAYSQQGYTQFIGRTINDLGMQLLNTKAWDEAFDMFNYLVMMFPTAPQAYDSLSYAYFRSGDIDKAKEVFAKAIQMNAEFNSDYVSDNYGNK